MSLGDGLQFRQVGLHREMREKVGPTVRLTPVLGVGEGFGAPLMEDLVVLGWLILCHRSGVTLSLILESCLGVSHMRELVCIMTVGFT